jgi:hypothetical protein
MLTVVTPAATTDLTTLPAVRAELDLRSNDEDVYLRRQISIASEQICDFLLTATATDGTQTLGRETLSEKFEDHHRHLSDRWGSQRREILLARIPVVSITSVTVDETVLDPATYEVDGATGILRFMKPGCEGLWGSRCVVVVYVAGWLLPGDADRNLPRLIENAAIEYVKTVRLSRSRDPLVKSEEVPGVYSAQYWVGPIGDGESALPPDIAAKLSKRRNMRAV